MAARPSAQESDRQSGRTWISNFNDFPYPIQTPTSKFKTEISQSPQIMKNSEPIDLTKGNNFSYWSNLKIETDFEL
jgi:hypothetical protein